MRNFENRIALAEVLDRTHKKVIIETLGRFGAKIASNSWSEIDDVMQADNQALGRRLIEADLNRHYVEYVGEDVSTWGGAISVGELFGETHTLLRSGQTDYLNHIAEGTSLGSHKYERRIGLYAPSTQDTFPDFTSLYVLRDMPPVVVHGGAIAEIVGYDSDSAQVATIPDTEIIERAQKEIGPKGFEYLS